MRLVLAQLNPIVGDLVGNTNQILDVMSRYQNPEEIVIFPELSICGYPPLDLVEEPDFLSLQRKQLDRIIEATKTSDAYVVIGLVGENSFPTGKRLYNALHIYRRGSLFHAYHKHLLPTYNIFDEARHFEPGSVNEPVSIGGHKFGFLICEDIWNIEDNGKSPYKCDPVAELAGRGAETIISINASPSNVGKMEQRLEIAKSINNLGVDFVYVNQVGANDDIVFDGNSFIMTCGVLRRKALAFIPDVLVHDMDFSPAPQLKFTPATPIETIYEHVKLGIRDYVRKCGFKKVVVGSSGGIDSAVVLAMAVEALGAQNVAAITMPSQYSSAGSVEDSIKLCKNLGIRLYNMPIRETFDTLKDNFAEDIVAVRTAMTSWAAAERSEPEAMGLEWENTQARIRGTILMAFSNRYGHLVLSTGNKSEMSVGYCTLYGDMNGGLAVLADVYKMEVFELARFINDLNGRVVIPIEILDKAPSAELAPDQKDTDSLPPYPVLDAILKHRIEWKHLTPIEQQNQTAILFGHEASIGSEAMGKLFEKVDKLLSRAEFKRRQAPPCIRCHPRAWGAGRRVPIAQKYLNTLR